jgi:hypothetical protein
MLIHKSALVCEGDCEALLAMIEINRREAHRHLLGSRSALYATIHQYGSLLTIRVPPVGGQWCLGRQMDWRSQES